MKTFLALAGIHCILAAALNAQGRSNWPTFGGDAERSGWEKAEARISKDTVKDLQLFWKIKLENQSKGPRALMPPLIVGNLISYRGFKELAFVAANSDIVYAIDADLGRMFWTKHLEYASLDPPVTSSSFTCPGGLTAMPTMPPPAAGRGGPGGGAPRGGRGPAPARGGAAGPEGAPAPAVRGAFVAGVGPASVYAISGDGRLHRLNTSTGDDQVEPVKVLPPNATAHSLNMSDDVIYTVTGHDCNGAPNAVWAIDLTANPPKTTSFALTGSADGIGGVAIGTDGDVYVQTSEKLLALSAKDLEPKHELAVPGSPVAGSSPLVFTYHDRDLIAAMGKDGRLNLLDAASLTLLAQSSVIATNLGSNLASWQDSDGNRWIFVPARDGRRLGLHIPGPLEPAPNGCIVAFKVEEKDGKTVLTAAWQSRDISSPEPPVIANGVVFALSPGPTHATLYALDGGTGKELYSSRNLVTAPAALTGMTVANGRVYFGTTDGTAYAFGIYMEH